MAEEEKGMHDYQKSEADEERSPPILTKLSEIESRIKLACAEENYDLAGWAVVPITLTHSLAHLS